LTTCDLWYDLSIQKEPIMTEKLKPLDITSVPEVRRLVDEVLAADQPRLLQIDRRNVAVLAPSPAKRTRRRGRPTSADDPLWNIVGLAQSDGPGDVSENVDAYLVQAYRIPNGV
jgi:hypothetical protein